MISVDGDSSTNDMVILLANGAAGNEKICEEDENYQIFVEALNVLNVHLSKTIARDGEGASKLLEVCVTGAKSLDDAQKLARHVVKSNLVKVAAFAEDANWGRILAAMGASGVHFDLDKVGLSVSSGATELSLLVDGMPYWADESQHKAVLAGTELKVIIDLAEGEHSATSWGCDLTHEYIDKGGNYRKLQRTEKPLPAAYIQGGVA